MLAVQTRFPVRGVQYLMRRLLARELFLATILAVFTAVLYRYWLIFPILQYLAITRWRLVALLVAVILGSLAALLRIRTYFCGGAVLTALLFGGALTFLFLPVHDVRTTFFEQFVSHFSSLWRDVMFITCAAVMGNFLWTLLVRKARAKI